MDAVFLETGSSKKDKQKHSKGWKARASELSGCGGRCFLPALPVHQEGVDERQESEEHQHHIHLEGGGEVRQSPGTLTAPTTNGGPVPCLVISRFHSDTMVPRGSTIGYSSLRLVEPGGGGVSCPFLR